MKWKKIRIDVTLSLHASENVLNEPCPLPGPFWYTSGYISGILQGILQDHGRDGYMNGRWLAGNQ